MNTEQLKTPGMSREKVQLTSREIRRNFEEQYAASLKQETPENLDMALEIFERYARGRKLTDIERQIVAQVKILSAISTIRNILVQEIQSRKPANRQVRRNVLSNRRKLDRLGKKAEMREIYEEAVRTGSNVLDVITERAKKSMEQTTLATA